MQTTTNMANEPTLQTAGLEPPQQAVVRAPPPYTETDTIGHLSNISSSTTLQEDVAKVQAGHQDARQSTFYIVDIEVQDPNGQEENKAQRRRLFRPSGWMMHRMSPVAAAFVDACLFVMISTLFCFLIFEAIRYFSSMTFGN
ncbi:hypothetical protein QBC44DRAFT_312589 [Cladorrhinum sp. PSN332]|nr:hypothetical protein QBC44DRAFT_312589 [Cladorrhinum sp. PSN332]